MSSTLQYGVYSVYSIEWFVGLFKISVRGLWASCYIELS